MIPDELLPERLPEDDETIRVWLRAEIRRQPIVYINTFREELLTYSLASAYTWTANATLEPKLTPEEIVRVQRIANEMATDEVTVNFIRSFVACYRADPDHTLMNKHPSDSLQLGRLPKKEKANRE